MLPLRAWKPRHRTQVRRLLLLALRAGDSGSIPLATHLLTCQVETTAAPPEIVNEAMDRRLMAEARISTPGVSAQQRWGAANKVGLCGNT